MGSLRLFIVITAVLLFSTNTQTENLKSCSKEDTLNENILLSLSKSIIPALEGRHKGEAGRIAVFGGSDEYSGAPYFSGISSLKVGADLVYVITSPAAAPIIKSYSPDLIVIPAPSTETLQTLLKKIHLVIIGPGLGRKQSTMDFVYIIIEMCKSLKKPLVIDADGIYAIYKNVTVIKDYPSPGAILTPNHSESKLLQEILHPENHSWHRYWGNFVSILEKGAVDQYHSGIQQFNWNISDGGSGRRAGGQGDILTGALGTFYNWALKSDVGCEDDITSIQLKQSIATHAAAKLTRASNLNAFTKYGRSMLASDILSEIHFSFDSTFL